MSLFNVGELLDVKPPTSDVVPTSDGNSVLIIYDQLLNADASIRGNTGIFLDCMALLPEEQIPQSLTSYDKFIQITASPYTAFSYGSGMPAIEWLISVICVDVKTSEIITQTSFSGGKPSTVVTYYGDKKYIDAAFPIQDAVDYALSAASGKTEMTVSSDGIEEGEIFPQYGMFGERQDGDIPTLSIPITINGGPESTVCYAIQMIDPDSKPLCGYEWVHWMAVNIGTRNLSSNASIELAADMVQGKNDFGTVGYGGPTPPDKPHTYVITIYALDTEIDLQNGFTKEQFAKAVEGHVLAEAEMEGSYSN